MKRALAVLGLALAFTSPAAADTLWNDYKSCVAPPVDAKPLWDNYEARAEQKFRCAEALFNDLIGGKDSCGLLCRTKNEDNLISLSGFRKELDENLKEARTARGANAIRYQRGRLDKLLIEVEHLIDSVRARFLLPHLSSDENITGTVSGKVVPSSPRARVTISGNGYEYSGPADQEGGYVQADLEPGDYVVIASAGGKDGSSSGTLKEKGSLVLVVTLRKRK